MFKFILKAHSARSTNLLIVTVIVVFSGSEAVTFVSRSALIDVGEGGVGGYGVEILIIALFDNLIFL